MFPTPLLTTLIRGLDLAGHQC